MDMETDNQPPKPKEGEQQEKQLVVILVGAPGSGKSTFCEEVIRASARPWARICQDTINNGKSGSKVQCLTSAATALKDGKSIFIDRCNLEKEQRADFVKLGGPLVDVHAVVLDLPAKLCISRSVKRTGHEGNLQGGKAAAVVNRMLQKKELPKLSEGFSRITFCQNESNVQAALDTYRALGPSENLPHGCFGQKNLDAKVQLGIMKFLKKVDVPNSVGPNARTSEDPSSSEVSVQKSTSFRGTENESLELDSTTQKIKKGANIPTLAFPSISTADFQFDLEKASDVIVEKVKEFVHKLGDARLVLVDLSSKSKILSLVRSKAAQRNIDPNRFFTFVGDITRLKSAGGLHCNVIANATNWRLKPGGGGVNAAIFSAAGPALESATKEKAKSLLPGKALVVPLPQSSSLFSREGVTHVIHVLGPNMNPQRPNCLQNDYSKGYEILREAYTSLFEGFVSIASSQAKPRTGRSEDIRQMPPDSQDSFDRSWKNSLSSSDQKAKREGFPVSERNKKSKGPQGRLVLDNTNTWASKEDSENKKNDGGANRGWSSWAQALYQIAINPEKHMDCLLEITDEVVVLDDVYPKARKHLLVLARKQGLDQLADVREEHLQLLKTIHAVGLKWAEKLLSEDASLVFRLGYHSVPSMRQLHLHVISQDFDSKHLKNKKHWNSFNTEFFRDSVDVIEEVGNLGKATLRDDEKLLSMELRCHRCRSAHPSIPRLKSHISSCQAPFPTRLQQNGRLVVGKLLNPR